jgi:hypothetical protein
MKYSEHQFVFIINEYSYKIKSIQKLNIQYLQIYIKFLQVLFEIPFKRLKCYKKKKKKVQRFKIVVTKPFTRRKAEKIFL